jgi:HEAT repeat protein
VGSHEGYLSAEELLAWLRRERDAVAADPADVLLDGQEPDVLAVLKLTRLFGNRDPTIRAASMRRLVAYPVAAAPAVIKAFRDGNLATRLTALELLDSWRAPAGGIDPWRPETLTPLRTAALEEWVEDSAGVKVPASDRVTPDQLAEARAAIRRMIAAPSDEADAIREHLARFGQGLLPEVYEQLARADADLARERLLALRYRLAADDSRVLTWEGGLVRLAATDSRVRQRAAEELAGVADDRDRALLLELFGDPDPLVREISLRGLQQIGGKEATAALVKLLKDPAPNVRAAVLKQILENPRRRPCLRRSRALGSRPNIGWLPVGATWD